LVSPPNSGIAVFTDATVAASGVVLSSDGRVVLESLIGTDHWDSFGDFIRCTETCELKITTRRVSLRRRFSGAPCVLMKQAYDANYGHWLIDCLPCLAAIAAFFDLSTCRFIVSKHDGRMQDIYFDTLAACGIGREQIDLISWEHIHIDTLIYPLPMTRHPWVKSPAIVEFLEGISARTASSSLGPSRIYVSRNKGRTRRLLNEDALLDILRLNGFEIVYPESLSFTDQVRKFRDAEIVVGNCGAGLTNVVFCPRGIIVLALTTEAMQDDFFWDLVALKDGTYVSLHGPANCKGPDLHSDFTIDIPTFARLLEHHLATLKCRVVSSTGTA
jgi:capsular polysaccharide biosynthesis protein